jgi:hypothetical protein
MHARFIFLALIAAFVAALAVSPAFTAGPRFYSDDPIAREPESRDAAGAATNEIDLFYEIAYNLFVVQGRPPSNTRAQNINTIDEVPDSSWFTNRVGTSKLSTEEIARGPNSGRPPAPEQWTIIREKSAGVNPGFTARDANGETWFLQFEEPHYPGANSADVEVATKIFWGLGYNQVESYITTFDPAHVVIDPKATAKRPSGARTPYTRNDMEAILERVVRSKDGTYRASAGRLLAGKVIGNFRYSGTRSDDPNDIVPHEHRRELRALRVFGAWMNLVDLKGGNTLDTLVEQNGKSIIRHYLQDVGASLGVANDPGVWDLGWEHFYEGDALLKRLVSFGFALSPWQTVKYQEYPEVGRFEGDKFDPRTWKPHTPPPAYNEMRADDAFWAARRVAAFSDDLIRAAVHEGQFSDPAGENHLAAVIMKRRDKIAQAYLPAINPVVDPKLASDGTLTFGNAAVSAGVAEAPTSYTASWSWFDNATGATRPIGSSESATTTITAPRGWSPDGGEFVQIDIACASATHQSWQQPIHTHFRRASGGWKLVGLERLPQTSTGSPTVTDAKR